MNHSATDHRFDVGLLCLWTSLTLLLLLLRRSLDPALLQLLTLPLVFFLLWRIRIFGYRLPLPVLGFGVVGATFALMSFYSYRVGDEKFLVAPFVGDEFQAHTRVFRDNINERLLEAQSPVVTRFFRRIEKEGEARDVLLEDPNLKAVLWGTNRWLRVSTRPFPASVGGEEWGEQIGRLEIVQSLPLVGLSVNTDPKASYSFLSLFLSGLDEERAEGPLFLAASTFGHWTSEAHHGAVWYLLGNRALLRGMKEMEIGWLRCALRFYNRGLKTIRRNDARSLRASLENNRAIALIALGTLSGDKEKISKAKGVFRTLAKGSQSLNEGVTAGRRNFSILRAPPARVGKTRRGLE
jgi:hypothetical protein